MEMDEIKYDVFEDGDLVNSVSIKKNITMFGN